MLHEIHKKEFLMLLEIPYLKLLFLWRTGDGERLGPVVQKAQESAKKQIKNHLV